MRNSCYFSITSRVWSIWLLLNALVLCTKYYVLSFSFIIYQRQYLTITIGIVTYSSACVCICRKYLDKIMLSCLCICVIEMSLLDVSEIIQTIPWDTLSAAGEFVCPRCKSKYSHKGNFQRHVRYECGQPHRYKCQICGCLLYTSRCV